VIRVIDGDSIEVDLDGGILEVRMIGINANERGECHSEEALNYLAEGLTDTSVGVEIVATDQFGRALANVWLGEELVNLTLVASGLAIAQTPDPDNLNGSALVAAEEDAYESGLGLWAADACGTAGPQPDVGFDVRSLIVDPPGSDGDSLDDEYVVVENNGKETVDMTGWTLRDESSRNRMVFADGTTLAPGEQIEISSGCARRLSWCAGSPIWNNDGDMALLLDAYGTVVARARY
jgi:micrococcal nuclease